MVRAVRGAPRSSPYKGMNLNTASTLGGVGGAGAVGRGGRGRGPGPAADTVCRVRVSVSVCVRVCVSHPRHQPGRSRRPSLGGMQMSRVSPLIAFVKSGAAGPRAGRAGSRAGVGTGPGRIQARPGVICHLPAEISPTPPPAPAPRSVPSVVVSAHSWFFRGRCRRNREGADSSFRRPCGPTWAAARAGRSRTG